MSSSKFEVQLAVVEKLTQTLKEGIEQFSKDIDKVYNSLPKEYQTASPKKEYSVERQQEAQEYLYDKATSTPLVIPVGQKVPETQNEAIQRILLASGAITREQFEAALGVSYDGDYGDEDEIDVPFSVDEDFEQSRFASYIEVPNVETKQVDKATAVPNQQSQVASDNGDNSGATDVSVEGATDDK